MRPWFLLLIAFLPACESVDEGDTPITEGPDIAVDPGHDPCAGVPLLGRCVGDSVEICAAGTGSSETFHVTYPCGAGSTCAVVGAGAVCVPSGACANGATECRGDTWARCEGGQWQELSCAGGCKETSAGAVCREDVRTVRYRNDATYEARTVAPEWNDWSASTEQWQARRFLVLSFANGELLDTAITDDGGHFELDAVPPEDEDGDDYLVLVAARVDPTDGDRLAYALQDPGVGQGDQDVVTMLEHGAPDPSFWLWSFNATDVPADGGVYISLQAGSGAAHAYNYLSGVWDIADDFFGHRAGSSLVMWLGMGTTWSCGACFTRVRTSGENPPFDSQIFFPADANEPFWSGAVLAHELGHWVMSTYGASPGEGGAHVLGRPSHPGLAWSEGFATWFSAVMRDERNYYDKQDGLFFWIDYDAPRYSGGEPWYRPEAAFGLEQLLDENEVTRMLLGMTDEQNLPRMLMALSSPRMTQAPFLRGYLRRTWDGLDDNGLPLPAWSTNDSAPHLADYLDALVCDGAVPPDRVDAQTEPWAHYPYPSVAPLCRRASLPIEVTWSATGATVRWYVPLARELVLSPLPTGAPRIVPAGSPPGELYVAVGSVGSGAVGSVGASGERGLRVATGGEDWAIAGTSRPARAAPSAPRRDGPRVVMNGRDLGRAIHIRR